MTAPTSTVLASRPAADEHFAYFGRYIEQVPDGDVLALLETQFEESIARLSDVGERGAATRYAPGKWSVKQMVGHVADTERIFCFRALCAARGERGGVPGFDENLYVESAHFDVRSLNSLLGEWTAVRRATLALFNNLDDEELLRRVLSNGHPLSARAAAWIIAGHERHHGALLRERYLPAIGQS